MKVEVRSNPVDKRGKVINILLEAKSKNIVPFESIADKIESIYQSNEEEIKNIEISVDKGRVRFFPYQKEISVLIASGGCMANRETFSVNAEISIGEARLLAESILKMCEQI